MRHGTRAWRRSHDTPSASGDGGRRDIRIKIISWHASRKNALQEQAYPSPLGAYLSNAPQVKGRPLKYLPHIARV